MDFIVKEATGSAIQTAIDEAAAHGGGRVVVEPGKYLTGTLYLKSNVELHVCAGAEIVGWDTPGQYDDFPFPEGIYPERSRKVLIAAHDCENIAITGNGSINGQGPKFYDTTKLQWDYFYVKPPHPRPRMVQFFRCRNVVMTDIALTDSPGWTCWLIQCEDVRISRVRVTGCQRMINNDGIDIDSCRNVLISDSILRTGDDCLVLRAIKKSKDDVAVCENVTVTNCLLDSPCQGIRVGCPSDDTIRHCQFSNITYRGRGNAIHFQYPYTYLAQGSNGYALISDLSFRNFDIEAKFFPIRIHCEGDIALRGLKRITFEDFRIRSGSPIVIQGNPNTVFEDITLSRFTGTVLGDSPLETVYVRRLKLKDVELTAETGEVPENIERKPSASWEAVY